MRALASPYEGGQSGTQSLHRAVVKRRQFRDDGFGSRHPRNYASTGDACKRFEIMCRFAELRTVKPE
jgi:hypothetical protein